MKEYNTCSTLGGGARPPPAPSAPMVLPSRWLRKWALISAQLAIRKMPSDQTPREASRKELAERTWSSWRFTVEI